MCYKSVFSLDGLPGEYTPSCRWEATRIAWKKWWSDTKGPVPGVTSLSERSLWLLVRALICHQRPHQAGHAMCSSNYLASALLETNTQLHRDMIYFTSILSCSKKKLTLSDRSLPNKTIRLGPLPHRLKSDLHWSTRKSIKNLVLTNMQAWWHSSVDTDIKLHDALQGPHVWWSTAHLMVKLTVTLTLFEFHCSDRIPFTR